MIKFLNDSENLYQYYLQICKDLYLTGPITDENKLSASGFLFSHSISEEEFNKAYCVEVCLIDEKPVGIIRIDPLLKEFEKGYSLEWLKVEDGQTNAEKIFFESDKTSELGVIAIDPVSRGTGIARQLLERVEKCLKLKGIKYLFSWVATKPNNIASHKFHVKNGFKLVAKYSNPDEFGFKPYEGDLFLKEIK